MREMRESLESESMCLTASHWELLSGRLSVEKLGLRREGVELVAKKDGHEKLSDGKQIFCSQGLSSRSWVFP